MAPSNLSRNYQRLSEKWAAIEPPTWALLLAESARSKALEVALIDAEAEKLSPEQVATRVGRYNPRIVCLTVYGQNVNAGTTSMGGAVLAADALKANHSSALVVMVGSHSQALPRQVLLEHQSIDVVLLNEGVYALNSLACLDVFTPETLNEVRGIGFRASDGSIELTPGASPVPTEKMDEDLPGYAWDLLPFDSRPLDLYRAPAWHAGFQEASRSPYAAIQTSLGCQFKCSFCMINLVNRTGVEEVASASDYRGMRFWSPKHVKAQIDQLVEMGVTTIKITDEMFLLYRSHYEELCSLLAEAPYAKELNMWAYSRIDTVPRLEVLRLLRSAGFRWLAVGIETANQRVRLEVTKGKFTEVDIREVVDHIHEADIQVMANYIVGLPGDDEKSMQETLDLSIDLGTAGWNMYTAMALPGSRLYKDALEAGVELPRDYESWSFHSYETTPLPTEKLRPEAILAFRDQAFLDYHQSEKFRERLASSFGHDALKVVDEMCSVRLKRRLLGD